MNDAAIFGDWEKMQRLFAFCDPIMHGVVLVQAAVRDKFAVVQQLTSLCSASAMVIALIQAANKEQIASVACLKKMCSAELLTQLKWCALLQDNWKLLAGLEKIPLAPVVSFSGVPVSLTAEECTSNTNKRKLTK